MQQAFFERLRGNHLVKKLSAFYKTGKFSKMFIKHPVVSRFSPVPISATCFQTILFPLVCLGLHIRSCLGVSRSTFYTHFSFPPCSIPGRHKTFLFFAQCLCLLRNSPSLLLNGYGGGGGEAVSPGVKFLGRECDPSRPSSG
jgi:hypothetical protein